MKYKDIKTPKDLLKFMEENITDGFVDKSGNKYTDLFSKEWQDNWYSNCVVQTGKNILKTKIGTCWDQVELERLWFKGNNYQFKTIFMIFELNKINNLPTHTCLIYKELDKYYWFEHSFYNNRGIHEFNSYNEAINYIKNKQLEHAINNYKIDSSYYNLLVILMIYYLYYITSYTIYIILYKEKYIKRKYKSIIRLT